jgi:YegS/Rv2252/BmrU family lipid kinase
MSNQKSFFIIVNPVAGKASERKLLKNIQKALAEKGYIVQTVFSEYHQHALELTQSHRFSYGEVAVSFGGDGTFNEVATGLVDTGTPVAILPLGSGNGLARSLKIKKNFAALCKYLINAKPVYIDGGKFSGKYFFCACGIGFDAHVAAEFNSRKTRGLAGYISNVIRTYIRYRPIGADLVIDGNPIQGRFFLVTFSNAPQYGNDAWIAPKADLTDGFLDVTFVRPFHWILAPLLALALFGGFIHRLPWVKTLKAKKIEINSVSSSHFHYDGESEKMNWPVIIEIVPKATTVLIL